MKKRTMCIGLVLILLVSISLSGCGVFSILKNRPATNGETSENGEALANTETGTNEGISADEVIIGEDSSANEDASSDDASSEDAEGNMEADGDHIDESEEGGYGDYISGCPEITYYREDLNEYDYDNNGSMVVEAYFDRLEIYSEWGDADGILEGAESINNCIEHEVTEYIAQLDGKGTVTSYYTPMRVDENVISLYGHVYFSAGTAYPTLNFYGFNLSSITGETLELADIMMDMEKFGEFFTSRAIDQMREMEDYQNKAFYDNAEDVLGDIENLKWYLDGSGICVFFNEEEIAPHACGTIEFRLEYSDLLDYMKPEYIPNLEDGYLMMPRYYKCQTSLISGMEAGFWNGEDNDGGYITVDKTSYQICENGAIYDAYLYKRAGRIYVFVNFSENGRFFFSVYDITDGTVVGVYSKSDVEFKVTSLSEETLSFYSEEDEHYSETINIYDIFPLY